MWAAAGRWPWPSRLQPAARRCASVARRLAPGHNTKPATAPAAAAALPSLSHLPPDIRPDVTRALELADRAAGSWAVTHTDFLTPPAAGAALAALAGRADVAGQAWGGWPGAERCRLILADPERCPQVFEGGGGGEGEDSLSPALLDPDLGGVAAVQLRGRFTFEAATHRDFLGAVLRGGGLHRRVIGDIVVDGERGATVFMSPAVVAAVEAGVTGVRGVSVAAARVDLADVKLAPPRPPTVVQTTEASLRLDAIASAGFRSSRSKMAAAISKGDVRVNWVPATKPAVSVAAGDTISVSGKGRVEVVSAVQTKKGRWAVELVRYA